MSAEVPGAVKVYVWRGTGILQDYGTGLIVAIATNLREAKTAARAAGGYARGESSGLEDSLAQQPEVIQLPAGQPLAWFSWGSQ